MSDYQKVIGNSSLMRIWLRIRDELAIQQDRAQGELYGQVVNPISGSVYSQNTGCAALVFATEYIQNGENEWLLRARRAFNSLAGVNVLIGVDEPKWNRLGWHHNRGSLFATGTLLDALWKTQGILRIENDKEGLLQLLIYLKTCRIGSGQFSHDSIKPGQKPVPVQNVTAIALYLMETIALGGNVPENDLLGECEKTLGSLLRGQRFDGFWPYVYPNSLQQITFHFPAIRSFVKHLPIVRRYFIGEGDRSILFGDAVHHCLVLYYLAKSVSLRHPRFYSSIQALSKGWNWIQRHLLECEDGGLRFSFDWEPAPTGFRYANFRDTSTYFLILAMLPILTSLGVVIEEDNQRICNGLLKHMDDSLLQGADYPTSIKPYEGPDEVLKWILPRVGEASAWKGALLAEYILNNNGTKR